MALPLQNAVFDKRAVFNRDRFRGAADGTAIDNAGGIDDLGPGTQESAVDTHRSTDDGVFADNGTLPLTV